MSETGHCRRSARLAGKANPRRSSRFRGRIPDYTEDVPSPDYFEAVPPLKLRRMARKDNVDEDEFEVIEDDPEVIDLRDSESSFELHEDELEVADETLEKREPQLNKKEPQMQDEESSAESSFELHEDALKVVFETLETAIESMDNLEAAFETLETAIGSLEREVGLNNDEEPPKQPKHNDAEHSEVQEGLARNDSETHIPEQPAEMLCENENPLSEINRDEIQPEVNPSVAFTVMTKIKEKVRPLRLKEDREREIVQKRKKREENKKNKNDSETHIPEQPAEMLCENENASENKSEVQLEVEAAEEEEFDKHGNGIVEENSAPNPLSEINRDEIQPEVNPSVAFTVVTKIKEKARPQAAATSLINPPVRIHKQKCKSGRFWKSDRDRFSSVINTKKGLKTEVLKNKLKKKQKLREEMKRVKEYERRLKEDREKEIEQKRKRREENKKRRQENSRKAEVTEEIKNPDTIKRMKMKQPKMIAKRDTTKVGK